MAGDWIKMRPSLLTNPKVNGIARILEGEREVSRVLSTGFSGAMSEIVTRNVMRNVTVRYFFNDTNRLRRYARNAHRNAPRNAP